MLNNSSASFWILTQYKKMEESLENNLKNYELIHSISSIYQFLWDNYADWYVEYLKTDASQIIFAKELFKNFVISCSPYCPFETEVLWSQYFGEKTNLTRHKKNPNWTDSILTTQFNIDPQKIKLKDLKQNTLYKKFESVKSFINTIRSLRGLFAIDPSTKLDIYTTNQTILSAKEFAKLSAKVELIAEEKDSIYQVKNLDYSFGIDILSYVSDKEKEIKRTNKQVESLNKQINSLKNQLSNPKFVNNANDEIISKKKQDLLDRQTEFNQQKNKLEFLVSNEK